MQTDFVERLFKDQHLRGSIFSGLQYARTNSESQRCVFVLGFFLFSSSPAPVFFFPVPVPVSCSFSLFPLFLLLFSCPCFFYKEKGKTVFEMKQFLLYNDGTFVRDPSFENFIYFIKDHKYVMIHIWQVFILGNYAIKNI